MAIAARIVVGSLVVALAASAGCGRIAFDPLPLADALGPPDGDGARPASVEAGAPWDAEDPDAGVAPDASGLSEVAIPAAPDAGSDGGVDPCLRAPFGAPRLTTVSGLDGNLFGPRPLGDGRLLLLSHTTGNGNRDEDIFMVFRAADRGAPYGRPLRLDGLSSAGAFDGSAFVTADGLEIFFSSARPGGAGGRDIWVTRRRSVSADWSAPAPVAELGGPGDEQNPSLTADGLVIFFASDRDGQKDRADIFTARRATRTAPFAPPEKVTELSGAANDNAPFVSPDGLTVLFVSNRDGGDLDLYGASRSGGNQRFGTPMPLPAVNSPADEDDPALSPDGRDLFFASNRADRKTFAIYRASRCE